MVQNQEGIRISQIPGEVQGTNGPTLELEEKFQCEGREKWLPWWLVQVPNSYSSLLTVIMPAGVVTQNLIPSPLLVAAEQEQESQGGELVKQTQSSYLLLS